MAVCWVKAELFDTGVLPPSHRAQLEMHNLFLFLSNFYSEHDNDILSITFEFIFNLNIHIFLFFLQ